MATAHDLLTCTVIEDHEYIEITVNDVKEDKYIQLNNQLRNKLKMYVDVSKSTIYPSFAIKNLAIIP